jgi:hypothetical protein
MEKFVSEIIYAVRDGKMSVDEATRKLLLEMGRGGRVLVVDEHLFGLDHELARLNYTVNRVKSGADDSEILQDLDNRVFITKNREHFKNEINKFNFGLIIVKSKYGDYIQLAKMISDELMKLGFRNNLLRSVNV